MTRVLKRRHNALSMLVGALVTVGAVACGPGRAPAEQTPMQTLAPESLEAFRQQFNQAADQTRVVLLLSPT
jgi:hypothetical protein